jgi:hypothetical protein
MRASRLTAVAALLAAMPGVAHAQPAGEVVTSPGPVASSVTVYHAADGAADDLNLDWLQGYALITETREIDIPAGRATIRFEGVAAGMLPESAIVAGLPAGVREKNLDADLLSPRSLYARSFGRAVILRRQDPRTGATREERAIIRSGADGAAILQTAKGFEAADCGSRKDELAYPELPPGLSARPTLSVETDSAAPAHVRLTLSYLSWGFDWRANYVLRMRPDGRQADLTAWVTLASSDATSFAEASAAVVGGKLAFDEQRNYGSGQGSELVFRCYMRPPPPPPPPPAPMMAAEIVVTARRVAARAQDVPVTMQAEGLGDLTLYRMPVPTTVAAHAQKQVALFDRRLVTLATIYTGEIADEGDGDASILLRTRNTAAQGLGVALPAGEVTVFEPHAGEMVLAGKGRVFDKAVGERVEIGVGESPQVHVATAATGKEPHGQSYAVTVANAHPWPIRFEGKLRIDDDERIASSSTRLVRKDGYWLWAIDVPANGQAMLKYRLKAVK